MNNIHKTSSKASPGCYKTAQKNLFQHDETIVHKSFFANEMMVAAFPEFSLRHNNSLRKCKLNDAVKYRYENFHYYPFKQLIQSLAGAQQLLEC